MNFFKKNFSSLIYFYKYLGHRVFIALVLSFLVGVLDGFGLAMFLPLLQIVGGGNDSVDSSEIGNFSFLIEFFRSIDISLNIYTVLFIILFFFSLKGVVKFFEGYLRATYQQYFIKHIRKTNAHYLANFSYGAFVNADSGRIQNTFSGEVERVNQAYRTYFMSIQAAILVLVYMSFAFLADHKFAILITVGGFLTNLLFKKLYSATKSASRKLTMKTHEFQGLLIQKVAHFKYLKATALIHEYKDKLIASINQIEGYQKKIGVLSAILQSVREPLTIFIVVVVIIIQVRFLGESLGPIVLSLLFFYRALTFLMTTQNYWNSYLSVSGSLENLTSFTNDLAKDQVKYGGLKFENFKNKIIINNVSCKYLDQHWVLSNINLTINKNDIIAIVGESGSGKTTLMNVLVGLINPNQGEIYIDDLKLSELNLKSFQKRIGYITQEPVIFNDTVFNNVTFWAEKNNDNIKRFEDALKKASILDFVYSLPEKEEELLGNNGINLSGGQRQRISIARELYKEVDFLMMDEATSALDSETERDIHLNIEALKGRYTIVIIAHRLSTIKNADKIILLKSGKIDMVGTFDQLKKESRLFQNMVNLQEF